MLIFGFAFGLGMWVTDTNFHQLFGMMGLTSKPQGVEVTPPSIPEPTVPPRKTPTPIPHRYAPAGVYFLLQRVKLTTDSGIEAFPAGTQVQEVSKQATTCHIRIRDGLEMDIPIQQLTNDLDVAALLKKQDQLSRQQVAKIMAREQALWKAQQTPTPGMVSVSQQVTNAPMPTPNPLDKGSYNQDFNVAHPPRIIYHP